MPFPQSDELTKPYRGNPTMYEQACLRAVMRGLGGLPLQDPSKAAPHNVHAVFLEGGFPDTRLVLILSRDGPQQRMDFGLWDDEFGAVVPDDSNRASPEYVSSEVMMQVYEFA